MHVQLYYSGLNIFGARAPQLALATPVHINTRSGDAAASSSTSAPSETTPPKRDSSDGSPAVRRCQVAVAWKSFYVVIDDELHIVGEGGPAVWPSVELRAKGVAASWTSFFVLTANDELVTSDIGSPRPGGTLKVGSEDAALRALAAGESSMFVLAESGEVFAGAAEANPCFRSLSLRSRVKSVDCGKEHAMLLTQLGQVYTYGSGSRGQLGHGGIENEDGPRLVEALDGLAALCIAAGGWHSVAVSDIGDIYVWGWNESGQLGLPCRKLRERALGPGRTANARDDIVTVLALPRVLFTEDDDLTFVDASCGSRHTVALTDDNRLFAWGWNDYGQLALGDLDARDSPCEVRHFTNGAVHPVQVKCGYWSTVIVCTSTSCAGDD